MKLRAAKLIWQLNLSISLAVVLLFVAVPLFASVPELTLPSACAKDLAEIQVNNSNWRPDAKFGQLANVDIPQVEGMAIEILKSYSQTEAFRNSKYVRFYETMDGAFRKDPKIPEAILKLSLRRLPYLRNGPFVIILSGGIADSWAVPLEKTCEEEGLSPIIVKLPGALSVNRIGGRVSVPTIPADLADILRKTPAIFIDDTYSTGGTAVAVRRAIQQVGGSLDGVFVAYDNSRDNASAIYKSGRMQGKPVGETNFPVRPDGFKWVGDQPLRIGINVEGSLLRLGDLRLTPQGRALLTVLNDLGAEVQLQGNEKSLDRISFWISKYPQIHWLASDEQVDVTLGNTGRSFYGAQPNASYLEYTHADNHIETIAISRDQVQGRLQQVDLEEAYLINVLVNYGVLVPTFQNRTSQVVSLPYRRHTYDLTAGP